MNKNVLSIIILSLLTNTGFSQNNFLESDNWKLYFRSNENLRKADEQFKKILLLVFDTIKYTTP